MDWFFKFSIFSKLIKNALRWSYIWSITFFVWCWHIVDCQFSNFFGWNQAGDDTPDSHDSRALILASLLNVTTRLHMHGLVIPLLSVAVGHWKRLMQRPAGPHGLLAVHRVSTWRLYICPTTSLRCSMAFFNQILTIMMRVWNYGKYIVMVLRAHEVELLILKVTVGSGPFVCLWRSAASIRALY